MMKKRKKFTSEDLAAHAFGCEALPLTAMDARERGAVLYPVSVQVKSSNGQTRREKMYTYGRIFTGAHNNVVFGVVTRYLLWLLMPKTISFLHTHPSCTGHRSDEMSKGDEMVARLWGVDYMYLASPRGRLYKYDGKNGRRDSRGGLVLEHIYDDMPKISFRVDCKAVLPRALTKKQVKAYTEKNTLDQESISTHV
ncbi:MAG: hypothetical protein AB1Z19_02840 [Eubacteriales bacterium]